MNARSVLIVDDNVDLAENICEILEEEGLEAVMAESAEQALRLMEDTSFSLVISDIRMAGMTGVELLRRVSTRWPETPVVLMTAYARDRTVQDARREGAVEVLRKPLDVGALVELVDEIGARRSILVVEDDEDLRENLRDILASASGGHHVMAVASQSEALASVERRSYDFAVIDIRLPDGSGLELARALQERLEGGCPAIVFMSAFPDEIGAAARAMTGATAPVEVLRKPFSPAALLSIVRPS